MPDPSSRNRWSFKSRCLGCAAIIVALAPVHAALAQSAQSNAPLNLDKIVVTGTSHKVTKMKSSVSVSTLSADQIRVSGATSAADVLRSVPGIQSQSTGGNSNANLTVRGLPISAGGMRYVQMQEDGLPVLDFGDIAFATPDSFVRVDGLLDQVQVVRGGTGSTLATNAPGGIVNFISKTGEVQGGSVALTTGLGYNENRLDFDYGGPIDANDRAEIAGFYHRGTGVRSDTSNMDEGGQIHGNFTHDIDGGFVRLNFQYLNDQNPTDLPVPVTTVNGKIETLPGIDPRTASFYSPSLGQDITLTDGNGTRGTDFNTGFLAKTAAIGFVADKTFDNGINLDDNFRYAANSGTFMGLYPANNSVTLTGATYATGPLTGQAYNGAAFTMVAFDTRLNNMNNLANDLKASKAFDAGTLGTITPTAGFYVADQNLDLTWNFNQYYMTATGSSAQLLDGTSGGMTATGTLPAGGVGSGFGDCCDRTYRVSYLTTSPYFDLGWAWGNLTSDASVREDIQHANGWFNGAVPVNGQATYLQSNQDSVNYSVHHTSYSIGSNYEFTHDLAVFARVSDGVSFNADRIINPGQNDLNGSAPIPINEVQQYEGGVKARYGNFNAFITLFDADTSESNYDVTTQVSSANKYNSYGSEIELGYVYQGFRISAGTTYTHSRITSTNEAGALNNVPQRQAAWIFQINPSYTYGQYAVGGSIIGTTSSYGDDQNTIVMPGYALVNLYASYQITPRLQGLITADNVANTIAYSELDDVGTGTAAAARAFDGRSVQASVRYKF